MKGLLLKDLYMAMKYCRVYLFMAVIFIAVFFFGEDNMFFMLYPCLLCGMIPVNLLSYDERGHWTQYSETLPYTKEQLVSVKYLIGLCAQCAMLLVSGAAYAVKMAMGGNFQVKEFMALILLMLMTSIIAPTLSLPFIFKLGVERGRIGYFVMIGIICGLSYAGAAILALDSFVAGKFLALPICCPVVIALYIVSWRLSIAFYKNREL